MFNELYPAASNNIENKIINNFLMITISLFSYIKLLKRLIIWSVIESQLNTLLTY